MAVMRDDTERRVIFPTSNLSQRMGARRLIYQLFSAIPRAAYRAEDLTPQPGMKLPVKDSTAGAVVNDGQSVFQRFAE